MIVYVLTMDILDNKYFDNDDYHHGDEVIAFNRYIGTYENIEEAAKAASIRVSNIITAVAAFEKDALDDPNPQPVNPYLGYYEDRTKFITRYFAQSATYRFEVNDRWFSYAYKFKIHEENV